MNRLFRALADRLVAPLLLDQVTAAYERGWRDGIRESMSAEALGRPSEAPSARRVIGPELHGAWADLGLTYLAARLREVQERTVELVYTPSWSVDGALAGDEAGPPVSLRDFRATVRGARRPRYLSVRVGNRPPRIYPLADGVAEGFVPGGDA